MIKRMENKNILLIILGVSVVVLLFVIGAVVVPYYYYRYNEPIIEDTFTQQESERIAKQRVEESYPYIELEGDNLVKIGTSVQDCDSCYSFRYRMEVNSQKVPEEREFAEMEIFVENGIVTQTDFSEGLIIDNIMCTEEQRNVEVCITLYEPVCGYNSQRNKIKTYSNSCFACLDTEVEFYRLGEC